VRCSVLQCDAVYCRNMKAVHLILQCGVLCCSVLQCVAVCCSNIPGSLPVNSSDIGHEIAAMAVILGCSNAGGG